MPFLPYRVGRRLGKDRDEEPRLGGQREWLVELDVYAVEVGGEGNSLHLVFRSGAFEQGEAPCVFDISIELPGRLRKGNGSQGKRSPFEIITKPLDTFQHQNGT